MSQGEWLKGTSLEVTVRDRPVVDLLVHDRQVKGGAMSPITEATSAPKIEARADPKISQVSHISVVTRDLDRSLEFYVGMLGMRIVEGPYEREGPPLEGILYGAQAWGVDVKKEGRVRCAFLQFGDGYDSTIIEPVEFVIPRPYGGPYPTLWNVGIARIALKCEHVHQAYEDLRSKGVKFHTPPITTSVGDRLLKNTEYCCFWDPDGIVLELFGPA
jgi:catechol 2,3-dioxygenase-like lactoylglutathione lyase family enzyme